MGYFNGLVAGSFSKDEEGRTLFFPWGVFGRGRIVPSEEDAEKLRNALKLYFVIALPGIICAQVFFGWKGVVGVAAAAILALLFGVYRRLQTWEPSAARLRYNDAAARAAQASGLGVIVTLLAISLGFTAIGVAILFDAESRMIGLVTVVFGGAGFLVFSNMLRLRTRARPTGGQTKAPEQ